MPTTLDPSIDEATILERQRTGADRFDEVWDGVYFMAPLADLQHQDLGSDLTTICRICVDWVGLGKTFCGVNISDRRRNWRQNFRCPDVATFLAGTKAVAHKAHWFGGPDFGIEIVSANDRTFEKIPFYEKVGTTELLIVEREPWALRLYRREEEKLRLVEMSTCDPPNVLRSEVVPLSFQLVRDEPRKSSRSTPVIENPVLIVAHHDGRQSWRIQPTNYGAC